MPLKSRLKAHKMCLKIYKVVTLVYSTGLLSTQLFLGFIWVWNCRRSSWFAEPGPFGRLWESSHVLFFFSLQHLLILPISSLQLEYEYPVCCWVPLRETSLMQNSDFMFGRFWLGFKHKPSWPETGRQKSQSGPLEDFLKVLFLGRIKSYFTTALPLPVHLGRCCSKSFAHWWTSWRWFISKHYLFLHIIYLMQRNNKSIIY